ncbi:MAG: hypothetical protein AAF366_06455 [Pseudomonadota bacterium]
MESGILILGLIVATFGAVLLFARIGKKRTEEKLDDPKAPKSALAKDGPTGSVEDRT